MNPDLQRVAEALPTGPSSPIWDLDAADSPNASETCPMSEHLSSVVSTIGCTTPIGQLDKSHVDGLSSSALLPDPCLGSVADLGEGLHGEPEFFDSGQDSFSTAQDSSAVHLDSINSALDSCDDSSDHLKRSESEEVYHVPGCDADILSCVKESCDKSTARLLFSDTPAQDGQKCNKKFAHPPSLELASISADQTVQTSCAGMTGGVQTSSVGSSPGFILPVLVSQSQSLPPGVVGPCSFTVVNLKIPLISSTALQSGTESITGETVGPQLPLTLPRFVMVPGDTNVNLPAPDSGNLISTTAGSNLCSSVAGYQLSSCTLLTNCAGPVSSIITPLSQSINGSSQGQSSASAMNHPVVNRTSSARELLVLRQSPSDQNQLFQPVSFSQTSTVLHLAKPTPIKPGISTILGNGTPSCDAMHSISFFDDGNKCAPFTSADVLESANNDIFQYINTDTVNLVRNSPALIDSGSAPNRDINSSMSMENHSLGNPATAIVKTPTYPTVDTSGPTTYSTDLPKRVSVTGTYCPLIFDMDGSPAQNDPGSVSKRSTRSSRSMGNDATNSAVFTCQSNNGLSMQQPLTSIAGHFIDSTFEQAAMLPLADNITPSSPMSLSMKIRQPDGTLKTLQVIPVSHDVVKKLTNSNMGTAVKEPSFTTGSVVNISEPTTCINLSNKISVAGTYIPQILGVDGSALTNNTSEVCDIAMIPAKTVTVAGTYVPVIGDEQDLISDESTGITENLSNVSNKGTVAKKYMPMISDVITDYMDKGPDLSISSLVQLVTPPRAPHTFKCDLCSATFNRLGNYTRHRMIHTVHVKDDYRYKCDKCERIFLQKCDLKRHQLIHSKEEPYKCPVCFKGYVRNSDLQVHMRFHNREKTFVCSYCPKSFYQSGDLNRHVRKSHFQSKMLTCGHCDKPYGYAKEATLIRHMQTKHKDIILQSLKQKLGTSFDSTDGSPKENESAEEKVEVSSVEGNEYSSGPSALKQAKVPEDSSLTSKQIGSKSPVQVNSS